MSKKHAAGKTAVAPIAVTLVVAGFTTVQSGGTYYGVALGVVGVALFGVYHALDERRVQQALPGEVDEDLQAALATVDEEQLRELAEDVGQQAETRLEDKQ